MQGKFNKFMAALRGLGLGAMLWAVAQGAGAGVTGSSIYSEGGQHAGHAGDSVSLTIHESDLQDFNGALLSFSFDSSLLSFTGVDRDCNDPALPDNCSIADLFSDTGGIATYYLTVTTSPANLFGAADLFTLLFDIKPTAVTGDTVVSFTNFYDLSLLQDPLTAADYAGTYDRQSLSGTITVLDATGSNPLPVVGSAPLALTALALLALVARRRPGCACEQTPG
jgi:hypothetical protein